MQNVTTAQAFLAGFFRGSRFHTSLSKAWWFGLINPRVRAENIRKLPGPHHQGRCPRSIALRILVRSFASPEFAEHGRHHSLTKTPSFFLFFLNTRWFGLATVLEQWLLSLAQGWQLEGKTEESSGDALGVEQVKQPAYAVRSRPGDREFGRAD